MLNSTRGVIMFLVAFVCVLLVHERIDPALILSPLLVETIFLPQWRGGIFNINIGIAYSPLYPTIHSVWCML